MKFLKKIHEHFSNRFAVSKTKILLLAIALLFSLNMKAQGMPTYDNTNFISLVKQLVESGKQTAQMIKSVKFLKDAKEAIEKVSSVVQQLRAVEEIAKNNQRLINVMQDDLQDILNSPYIKPEEVTRIAESFDAIVQNSLDTIEFMGEILSSDNLKMKQTIRNDRNHLLRNWTRIYRYGVSNHTEQQFLSIYHCRNENACCFVFSSQHS